MTLAKLSENKAYDYHLPQDRIAQRPVVPYDQAKLMLVNRESRQLSDQIFASLSDHLRVDDLLVFNDSKVIPARLLGNIEGRKGEVELLLIAKLRSGLWRCLGRPMKKLKEGTNLVFNNIAATVLRKISEQELEVEFSSSDEEIFTQGLMPIPPYIRGGKADATDQKDYQSIFAQNAGSIAAPTASLHFTQELLQKIKAKGVETARITLHIGMASVRPLWDNSDDQPVRVPGVEYYKYDKNLLNTILKAKHSARRIIAVGTTVVRALESMAIESKESEEFLPTQLFIREGFSFKLVDALITNFHFPRSSHLLLVQALLGEELLDRAYQSALANNYRFLSYGDAMFIQ